MSCVSIDQACKKQSDAASQATDNTSTALIHQYRRPPRIGSLCCRKQFWKCSFPEIDYFMIIAQISIQYFRGIKSLNWSPSANLNCLIGPGDSCKTTVLDAIEIALMPRYGFTGSDPDLFNCDPANEPNIKVTLIDLPEEFLTEQKYGLHLRGWNESDRRINDEREDNDLEALTVQACLDPDSLEWRWEILNDRVGDDPPRFGFKDARTIGPNRLGEYADRHLSWSRNSVLSRLEKGPNPSHLLAQSIREARKSFQSGDRASFDDVVKLTSKVGENFLVPKSAGYEAQLDIYSGMLASGAVSLHDGKLPLRTLGSGSSRLMVAGLQDASISEAVTLVDEIELGLEPHRIMRLLRFLRSRTAAVGNDNAQAKRRQTFLTTHSPMVVCELDVTELYCVRDEDGNITIKCAKPASEIGDAPQRHIRSNPQAFLAPRIIIGEGRTECGFLRALDDLWCKAKNESFAFQGVVVVDGGGNDNALKLANHMQNLGYRCHVLLDTDHPVSEDDKQAVEASGAEVSEWPGECDIEQRIFLDVPWATVSALIECALEEVGEGRVLSNMRKIEPLTSEFDRTALDTLVDNTDNRKWLAAAATLRVEKVPGGKKEDRSWFKDMRRGELLGKIVFDCLDEIPDAPLNATIDKIRQWVDA